MLELIKSERFQTEYQMYQNRIEKITDIDVQKQATVLLKTLVAEIKKLDNQHQDMFSKNNLSMGLPDIRNNVMSIRKKIDKVCSEWEKLNQQFK
jgi:hypothetical protein